MPSVSAPSTSRGVCCPEAAACSAKSPTCGPLPCEMTMSLSAVTGAMARAATRTFSRWFATVMASPRFGRALPPSAMTMRRRAIALFAEGRDQDGLDGVQAILRLVEYDRRRRLEHIFGDFESVQAVLLINRLAHLGVAVVERGQAVQEFH